MCGIAKPDEKILFHYQMELLNASHESGAVVTVRVKCWMDRIWKMRISMWKKPFVKDDRNDLPE